MSGSPFPDRGAIEISSHRKCIKRDNGSHSLIYINAPRLICRDVQLTNQSNPGAPKAMRPTSRTQRRAAMIAAVMLAASPFRVAAQETGNAAEGRHLAGQFCITCHVITPTKQAKSRNGVPTFAAIARRQSTTPASLRNSLLKPHPQISSMQATPDELRDLTAYIMSLRGQ